MELDINLKYKKKFDFNSIMFLTLIRFRAVIVIIISLAWILEVVFYKSIYEEIKTGEVSSSTILIANEYSKSGVTENIKSFSFQKNINVVIFTKNSDGSYNILYNSTRVSSADELNRNLTYSLSKLNSDSQALFCNDNMGGKNVTCILSKEIDEVETFFYSNSFISPVESTVQVISMLLLIITILSIIISLLISYYYSRNIAVPIRKMANNAKKISSGDMNITFDGGEYTEISELADALNYSIGELKKTEELRRDVVSNVSHELRTPLTMIKSYSEMIRDLHGNDAEKREKDLNVILDESARLEYLVNDMIDLSKLQSKTMQYNLEKFDLSDIISKLKDFYQTKYSSEFVFNFDFFTGNFVFADKKRVEQVMINLINNAINYSKDKKQVDIKLEKISDNKCKFSVKDYGIGIEKKDQSSIFDKHFRATNAKRATVGSGIGLSIVKEICDYHNYSYGLESEINVGSTFYVEFTLVKD